MSGKPVKFWTESLVSKWGFGDGDCLDDMLDDNGFYGDAGHTVSPHKVLIEVVRRHVLPQLDQQVETYTISTIHNPIRARSVDGIEEPERPYSVIPWAIITPEFVDVAEADILAIARELTRPPTPSDPQEASNE